MISSCSWVVFRQSHSEFGVKWSASLSKVGCCRSRSSIRRCCCHRVEESLCSIKSTSKMCKSWSQCWMAAEKCDSSERMSWSSEEEEWLLQCTKTLLLGCLIDWLTGGHLIMFSSDQLPSDLWRNKNFWEMPATKVEIERTTVFIWSKSSLFNCKQLSFYLKTRFFPCSIK